MAYNTRRGGTYGGNMRQNNIRGMQSMYPPTMQPYYQTNKPFVESIMRQQQQTVNPPKLRQPTMPLAPLPQQLKPQAQAPQMQQPQAQVQQQQAQAQQQQAQAQQQQAHVKQQQAPQQQIQVQQQQPVQQQPPQAPQILVQHTTQTPPLKSILKKETEQLPPKEEVPMSTEQNDGYKVEAEGSGDESGDKSRKKGYWNRVKGGKISKKERRGRRNQRLRKILQPKSGLMVLNELVGGQKFNIVEKNDPNAMTGTFVASLTIDGIEHIGYGKNKIAAKNQAAEVALKHIILEKLGGASRLNALSNAQTDSDGDLQMRDESSSEEEDISWLHVASFALNKLFSDWSSDGAIPEQLQSELKLPTAIKTSTNKPAKQLPDNANLLNPVMLLNQMRPRTVYEDVAKEGNPPNITFTVKINIDGSEFFGIGGNKKLARKNCAYAACNKLFDIAYPEEVFPKTNFMQ